MRPAIESSVGISAKRIMPKIIADDGSLADEMIVVFPAPPWLMAYVNYTYGRMIVTAEQASRNNELPTGAASTKLPMTGHSVNGAEAANAKIML